MMAAQGKGVAKLMRIDLQANAGVKKEEASFASISVGSITIALCIFASSDVVRSVSHDSLTSLSAARSECWNPTSFPVAKSNVNPDATDISSKSKAPSSVKERDSCASILSVRARSPSVQNTVKWIDRKDKNVGKDGKDKKNSSWRTEKREG